MIACGPELVKTRSLEFLEVQHCGYLCQRVNLLMQLIAGSHFLAKYRKNLQIREGDLGLGYNIDRNGGLETEEDYLEVNCSLHQ